MKRILLFVITAAMLFGALGCIGCADDDKHGTSAPKPSAPSSNSGVQLPDQEF